MSSSLLFVGARLSLGAVKALSSAAETLGRRARDVGLDIRWVPPANYHLTLKYLGWTRTDAIPAITDALATAVAGTPRFEVELARLGAFASLDKATVLWAGVAAPDPVGTLAKTLEIAMTTLGFATETRPYTPHVTIGRLRDPRMIRDVVLPLSEQMFGRVGIDSVSLYESETKSNSSVYREVSRISFKQPPKVENRQTEAVDLSASEDTDDGWPRGQPP